MPKHDCHKAFLMGQAERSCRPLSGGRYKLVECIGQLESCSFEIQRIQTFQGKRSDKWSLRHCTPEDKHIWLKGVPVRVAHRLGYEYLPGLLALPLDGVPQPIVQRAVITSKRQCVELIRRLDDVHIAVKSSDLTEDHAMLLAGSLIWALVLAAIELTKSSVFLWAPPTPA